MNDFVVGLLADVVDVGKSNLAVFIHDKQRAFADAIGITISAVSFGNFAFGIEIGQQWVGDSAQTFCPGNVGWNGINRDTQNLGISLLEATQVSFVRRHLHSSDRRPIKRVERDEHVLFTPEIRELDSATRVAFQLEVRSGISNLKTHKFSYFEFLN